MNFVLRNPLFSRIILLPLLLGLTVLLRSQTNIFFKTLDRSDGLSQNTVFASIQDRDGFIWFGTRDGLNKYDGYRFRVYRSDGDIIGELADDDIRVLTYDSTSNVIWIGTARGLSRYLIALDSFTTYPSIYGQCQQEIRFCRFDNNGQLLVGTSQCLWRYAPDRDTFAFIDIDGINKNGQIPELVDIVQNTDGSFSMGTSHGLFVGDLNENKMICQALQVLRPELTYLSKMAITVTEIDNEGNLWVGSSNLGLFICTSEFKEIGNYHLDQDSLMGSPNRIQTIAFSEEGAGWIGTGEGLHKFKVDLQEIQRYPLSHQDSEVSVRSLLIDQKGSLWVGTYFDGIKYLDVDWGQFDHFRPGKPGMINHKVIGSMVEEPEGFLWIATEGGGINRFDPENQEVVHIVRDQLSGPNIKSLLMDGTDLWAGTFQRGLNCYNIPSGEVSEVFRFDLGDTTSIPSDNVYDLEIYQGDLWIATYGGGLARLNRKIGNISRIQHHPGDSNSLCNNLVRSLYVDGERGLLVGTDKGLDRLIVRGGTYQFEHLLRNTKVLCVFRDSKQNLWIGTRSTGLQKYNEEGEPIIYSSKEGLTGKSVFGILEDDLGYLWLSTDQGLTRFAPDQETFLSFSDSKGLENLEFNFNGYVRARSGKMYFGSTNGFVRFDPHLIRKSEHSPPLVFTDLRFGSSLHPSMLEKSLNYSDHLVFPYGQASFSLGFALLDYAHPGQHTYRYVLEGLEKDWQVQHGIPFASYTIQKEGNYLFRVQSSQNATNALEQERTIKITVTPPFYRSSWAKGIYVTIGLLFIYLTYYFIKLKKGIYLEKLSKKQQEELHEARLQLYTDIAHEFRSPLTLILSPLDRLINSHLGFKSTSRQLQSIKSNAIKLLDLVDQLITFRKAETDHLELKLEETEFIGFTKSIFDRFQIRAELQNIEFTFHCENQSLRACIDRDKMEKVLSNLLSNAFKFSTSGDHISLRLSDDGDSISFSVEDTGSGIPDSMKGKIFERHVHAAAGIGSNLSSGIGLALSKRMIDLHQGSIRISDGEVGGSKFMVKIPKGKQHSQHLIFPSTDQESVKKSIELNTVMNTTSSNNINEGKKGSAKLLIIEDDWDLLQYLKEIFSVEYEVVSSVSAQVGIDIARREVPDLIISDIMMHEVNGVELCTILKGDRETSHIPIILLTALGAKKTLLEGLKAGADDYLIKPFDPDELLLRVNNILKDRSRIRSRYTRALKMEPKSVKFSSIDESFLEKALLIIEENMDNTGFTANEFAKSMMVSRQLLFSKIKNLTSMTPNNLVKSVRMKRAHQILSQNSHTVAEVAKMVGFRDVRYFSRCFEKQYGMNPSQVYRLLSK